MEVEKCSNCGYQLTFGEAVEIYGRKKGSFLEDLTFTTFLNLTKIRCPQCGSIERWISEEENLIYQ